MRKFTGRWSVHDSSILNLNDVIGQRGDVLIVSDDDQGDLSFLMNGFEQFDNLAAGLRVEIAGRFVSQNDFRIGDEGATDGGALLLASGDFVGTVFGSLCQVEFFEKDFDGLLFRLVQNVFSGLN